MSLKAEVFVGSFDQEVHPSLDRRYDLWPNKWHGRKGGCSGVLMGKTTVSIPLRIRKESFGGLVLNTCGGAVYKVNRKGYKAISMLLQRKHIEEITEVIGVKKEKLLEFLGQIGVQLE